MPDYYHTDVCSMNIVYSNVNDLFERVAAEVHVVVGQECVKIRTIMSVSYLLRLATKRSN